MLVIMLADIVRIGKKQQARASFPLCRFTLRYNAPLSAQNEPKVEILKPVFACIPMPSGVAI